MDSYMVAMTPRQIVFGRDRGICALCGLNAERLYRAMQGIWHDYRVPREIREARRKRCEAALVGRGFDCDTSFWEADHIRPVVEGGPTTLENLRTLCVPCHKRVTREMHLRIAERRRGPMLFGAP